MTGRIFTAREFQNLVGQWPWIALVMFGWALEMRCTILMAPNMLNGDPKAVHSVRISFGCVLTPSDHLWVGTANSGVAMFDGKFLSVFDSNAGLPGEDIENIVQDKMGTFWIAYREGVCRYGGNLFTHYTGNKGQAFTGVNEAFYDSKDRLWISSPDIEGVVCIDGNKSYHYGQAEGFRFSNP